MCWPCTAWGGQCAGSVAWQRVIPSPLLDGARVFGESGTSEVPPHLSTGSPTPPLLLLLPLRFSDRFTLSQCAQLVCHSHRERRFLSFFLIFFLLEHRENFSSPPWSFCHSQPSSFPLILIIVILESPGFSPPLFFLVR